MTWTVYLVVSNKGLDIGNKSVLGRCLFHDAAILISINSKWIVIIGLSLRERVFRRSKRKSCLASY